MPIYDPSTHDDRIDISITLSQPQSGTATLTTILVLQDDVTPGGGLWAEYASPLEVAADVLAANLDSTSQKIADVMFGQPNPPAKILFGAVDLAGAETAPEALDLIIADGADFYGVLYDSRTVARQAALSVDIEAKADSGIYLLFGLQDDDSDWLTTAIPVAWSTIEDHERTATYYHDDNDADDVSDRLDCASFADRLSWDPDSTSAPWNGAVEEVDALATGLTQTQKAFARANFANVALPFGTKTDTYVDPGHNMNGRPISHIVSSDWLRARMGEAAADLIVDVSARGTKITIDGQGLSLMGGTLEAVMQLGVEVGHFLDYEFDGQEVTTADIAAQRLRYVGTAQTASGVLEVGVDLFFDTDPIA